MSRVNQVAAQAARQLRHVPVVAEHAQEAVFAFEHAGRPGEAFGGKACGENAAFGSAAHMEALDHRAVARMGEFQ